MKIENKIKVSVVLTILGIILGLIVKTSYVHILDLTVSHFLQRIQPNWFISLNFVISLVEFAEVFVVLPLFNYLLKKGKKKEAYFVLVSGLAWFLMRAIKAIFGVPCPTSAEVKLLFPFHGLENTIKAHINSVKYLDPGVCYPSGHVFDYISIWGMIYYLRNKIWENKSIQEFVSYLSIFLISLVGIARISLGAHFFSDVLGGYLLGFAWLLFLISLYSKIKRDV